MENIPLTDASADVVISNGVINLSFRKRRVVEEVFRVLKPGGVLAVTEFLPDPDYPWRSTTVKICQNEGFVLDASLGNLWNYTVRFRKPSSG